MDKVLIIDGDAEFLKRVKTRTDKLRQFDTLTASDGREAISILCGNRIAAVATDIEAPDLEALELLSHMSQKHPNTPCIIMTDRGKPWFQKPQSQQAFLYHLEKPLEINALVSALIVALTLRDEGASAEGMTIPSLLPLIEIQQKTCRMQIRSGNKRVGYLYFENGDIIDAHYGKLAGEYAAREIATWNRITFMISELPRHRNRRRVKTKLMNLAGATWTRHNQDGFLELQPAERSRDGGILFLDEEAAENAPDGEGKAHLRPHAFPASGDAGIGQVQKKAADWLGAILNEIKHIQGYQAIAVVDGNGRILAAEQKSEKLNLNQLAGAMAGFLASARDALRQTDFETAEAVTLHTKTGTVVMQQLDAQSDDPLCAMVACPPRSNWYFFKSRLENLRYNIRK